MAITPRDLDVDFEQVPRHWHSGNAIATGLSNGLNMLFPHGERFFVRSVKHFLPRIQDPELRAQIKAFFKQEGSHAREHDRFNAIMRAQGYNIDGFLKRYAAIASWVEGRVSPEMNLAITAASEHFTALFAEGAFAKNELDKLDPRMRTLLAWHAAEEIEHKSVAYDVLQAIDPSYALRVTGLALATILLAGFWTYGTITVLRQDGMTLRRFIRELRAAPADQRDPVIRRVFTKGIRQYLRRDFHPSQNPNEQLAADWFAARGMSLPEAA